MFRIDARSIQAALKTDSLYDGRLDGILGPMSRAGISRALYDEFKPSIEWRTWAQDRQQVAYEQLLMHRAGIETGDIDGLIGPQTRYAYELWQNYLRDLTPPAALVEHQPTVWPRQADVPSYFGERGANQVQMPLPFPMVLAWDRTRIVRSISLHKKVAESASRAFAAIHSTYGMAEIKRLRLDQFGGSFNVRKVRGGNSWSTHSWGIALDWDPENNQLRWGRDKAWLARPEYDRFWSIWEGEGWISLGRERNYDFMHVMAARL